MFWYWLDNLCVVSEFKIGNHTIEWWTLSPLTMEDLWEYQK